MGTAIFSLAKSMPFETVRGNWINRDGLPRLQSLG